MYVTFAAIIVTLMPFKQADSTQTTPDTLPQVVNVPEQINSALPPSNVKPQQPAIALKSPSITTTLVPDTTQSIGLAADSLVTDSLPVQPEPKEEWIVLYPTIKNEDSSRVMIANNSFTGFGNSTAKTKMRFEKLPSNLLAEKGWGLGLFLLAVILLVTLRKNYEKYLQSVFNSAANLQISEKLLRERNVLVKRTFFFLNAIFVVVMALYLYQAVKYLQGSNDSANFLFYLILQFSFILVLLLRIGAILLLGYLFDARPVYREYMHNTLILNKVLGIFLLPLVLALFYIQPALWEGVFFTATAIIALVLVYRYIRALQIIFKHKVFLLYSILYLCTLEILPVLVGIKIVVTQR